MTAPHPPREDRPPLEPDTGAQVDEGVEVAEAQHGQAVSGDEPGSDRLGRHQAAHTVDDTGQRIIAENVEAST